MTSNGREARLAAWLCALYALGTSAWYVVWRYCFAERSGDEATFENMLWNAAHGHGLRSFIESGGVPHLAVHFSPALYLLVPPYALFPSMHVVHFTVSALVALAGLAFHRHVSRRLDPRQALLLMLAFLLYPTLVLQTFMEFHEQSLAILPLTMLLIEWSNGRPRAALLWALALVSIREDNVLLVLALGAGSLLVASRRGTGVMLLALGVGWLALWYLVAFRLLGAGRLPSILGETYSQWGRTPGQILGAVATHPLEVVRHVVAPVPLGYLALLLGPFLLVLPFGSPQALLALPQLMMVLLAGYDTRPFQIRMHFSIVPAVVLFFSTVDALGRFGSTRAPLALALRRRAPVAMLAIVLLLSPTWAVRAAGRLNPFAPRIREVLKSIPDTASVTAPMYLLNHLANRRRIALEWNDDIRHTEYVVLENSSRFFFRGTTVDIFYSAHFDSLLRAGGYREVLGRDGWHVYRRGAATPGP